MKKQGREVGRKERRKEDKQKESLNDKNTRFISTRKNGTLT